MERSAFRTGARSSRRRALNASQSPDWARRSTDCGWPPPRDRIGVMKGLTGPNLRRGASLLLSGLALALALASQANAASGTWERAWGKGVNGGGVFGVCTVAASCLAGTNGGLGGEMNAAEDVATDAAGYVYVVDSFNNRIQKFDSSGNFLRAWGKDVVQSGKAGDLGTGFEICTVAADCQIGLSGGLGGEMNLPRGIVVDGAGNVYVADRYNYRIQKFDSNGTFERTWGKGVNMTTPGNLCTAASGNTCQIGTSGGGAGEFNAPKGVAIGLGGSVYVADTDNHRIQKFDPNGTFE